jgi:HlyD family secretion protein
MNKKILVIPLLLLVVGSIYFVNNLYQEKIKNESLTLYGNVDIRDVNLGFRVFGRIEQLNYEEGDRVKKGDVLAVLNKVPYEEDIAVSKAQLEQAKAKLTNAEKLYERSLKLTKVGAVSQTDLDNALSARDQAIANVEVAKAQLEKSVTNHQDTEIRAPNDGIILVRVREPGAVVAQGSTVYTLMQDRPLWIRTYVDEPALGWVYPGQKALVTTDSGGKYEGQVGFISPQAEFTPKTVETPQLRTDLVYRLRVIVDTPDQALRQGMPVTVVLKKAPRK